MAFALGEVLTAGPQEKVFTTGKHQWRIDKARPIEALDASQELLPLPDGRTLGDRKTADPTIIPTVRASKAWYIVVKFWWRGSDTEITYPSEKVSLGLRTRGTLGADSDWLLDHAVAPATVAQDPGDQTWGDVAEDKVKDTLKKTAEVVTSIGTGVVIAAVVVGGLYLLITRSGK